MSFLGPARRAGRQYALRFHTSTITSSGELLMARKIPFTGWSSHHEVLSSCIMEKSRVLSVSTYIQLPASSYLAIIDSTICYKTASLANIFTPQYYSASITEHYFSFGPAIKTLMPLPAFTLLKASSASSNLTVPVINFFTSTTPRLTKSTAKL